MIISNSANKAKILIRYPETDGDFVSAKTKLSEIEKEELLWQEEIKKYESYLLETEEEDSLPSRHK